MPRKYISRKSKKSSTSQDDNLFPSFNDSDKIVVISTEVVDNKEFGKSDNSKKIVNDEILIGDFLRIARENAQIAIDDVANYLRVRVNDIKTLESNDIEKIAKNIYIPGLIKSYGKYLKIDSKIIEEKLQDLQLRSNIEIKKHTLINIGEERKTYPSKDILINCTIIFVVLFIISLIAFSMIENNSYLINTSLITNDISKIDN